MFLRAAIEAYLTIRSKRLSPKTLRRHEAMMTRFLHHVGNVRLSTLLPDDVEAFFCDKQFDTIGATTFNSYRADLAAPIKYWTAKGWTKPGLMELVEAKPATQRAHVFLPPATLMRVAEAAAEPRTRAAIVTIENTGMRVSDMRSRQIKHVSLERQEIFTYIKKVRKEDWKPMTTELEEELRSYLTWYASHAVEWFGQGLDPEWFLFPSSTTLVTKDGSRKWRLRPERQWSEGCRLNLKAALKAAGAPDGDYVAWHTLRRSAGDAFFLARQAAGDTEAKEQTAEFLNHSNTRTTDLYLNKTRFKQGRDAALKGKPFLSAMVDSSNVTPIRRVADGEN